MSVPKSPKPSSKRKSAQTPTTQSKRAPVWDEFEAYLVSTIMNLYKSLKIKKKNTKYELFADLGLDQTQIPSHNAGVERIFNPARHIHSWARNRLSKKMVDTLLYCYVNYRLLKRIGVVI